MEENWNWEGGENEESANISPQRPGTGHAKGSQSKTLFEEEGDGGGDVSCLMCCVTELFGVLRARGKNINIIAIWDRKVTCIREA